VGSLRVDGEVRRADAAVHERGEHSAEQRTGDTTTSGGPLYSEEVDPTPAPGAPGGLGLVPVGN
jgi:hypothetical protein